jgi:hypothetical protein
MNLVIRAVLAAGVFVATYIFVYWVPSSMLLSDPLNWMRVPGSLICALAGSVCIWKASASAEGFLAAVVSGALTVGTIGFLGGFFGPMLLTPEANQGPMLGLFITGPLGFILGAVGGGIRWLVAR